MNPPLSNTNTLYLSHVVSTVPVGADAAVTPQADGNAGNEVQPVPQPLQTVLVELEWRR